VKAARVVGHTPKPDHYIYEIVLDFAHDSERVNAKIYRGKSGGQTPRELAREEFGSMQFVHEAIEVRKLEGMPRPLGDFTELGAVVSTKVNGLPLQSIIMKAALLPDTGNHALLELAARQAGSWLQQFHKATAGAPSPLDSASVLTEMEKLCAKAEKDGLPADSITAILGAAKSAFSKQKKSLRSSVVLQEFVPLNVLVTDGGIGFCEFAGLKRQGHSLYDAAIFMAAVEALEKYPFCNRNMTALVQDAFLQAYGVGQQELALLDALKMKVLLQMFAQGRATNKESAVRKKVMWANVMKRFIQQAAERSAAKAA
jgi:hypothetical protein